MIFNNEEELQDFLIAYLESRGFNCYKEFTLPSRGRIDILTNHHVIECKHILNSVNLDKAAGQLLGRYMPYFREHKPIIAGLSSESGRTVAESLRNDGGVEVWFIDEIEDIKNFYKEVYCYFNANNIEESIPHDSEVSSSSSSNVYYHTTVDDVEESIPHDSEAFSSSSSDIFSFLGIAAVVSIIIFFGIIAQYDSPINQLHKSAIAWDISTANLAISALKSTGDECNNILANRVESELYSALDSGISQEEVYRRVFNRINAMQLEIMRQHTQCFYPPLNHPDQLP